MDTKPLILGNEYPKAFFFRQTESIESYIDYDHWDSEFSGLMGVMGKALAEEKSSRTSRSAAFYSKFKKEHPEQVVLLHYNGNACDPRFDTGNFFAGHWLYHNGTKITEDLPENWSLSTVRVEDAGLFSEYVGRFFDRKEDVVIVRLDEQGKPDWFCAEQAVVREVDYEKNTLSIARAQYNTRARAFEKGKAMISAHVVEGPWPRSSNLMWFYNHSTACPKDENGRNCGDVLSDLIAERFRPGGQLCRYDGIELDVLFRYLFHHSYAYIQDWGPGKPRQPDCDGDGEGDMGIIDGVDTYENGVAEFVRKTRVKLDEVRPRIIFQADAGYSTQRSFGFMNGVETEGYGKVEDGVINWTDIMNVHGFWNENSCKPVFSYLNHRLREQDWSVHRVAFSSSVYTGSAVCQATSPPRNPDGSYGVFDELVKGREKELAWLGKPEGPPVHLVHSEKDLIDGATPSQSLLSNIRMEKGTAEIAGGTLVMKGEGNKDISFVVPGISLPSKEFTLFIRSSCDSIKAYYPELARIITVRPVDENGNSLIDDTEWWFRHRDRRWGYSNSKPFDNYFFFHEIPVTYADIEVTCESSEPVRLQSIQLYAAPDAMYRIFENGIVMTNPGLRPRSFDLKKISPGRKYRRLSATECQDAETNNGQPAGDCIILGRHDALFLAAAKV